MKTSHFLQLSFAALPSLALAADASSSPKPEATAVPVKIVAAGAQHPAPVYPKSMAEKGVGGKVMIEAVVDPAGKVSSANVIESSDPAFSEAAVKAVLHWRFKSIRKDEPQKPRKFQIPLSFAIASTPAARKDEVKSSPTSPSPAPIAAPPSGPVQP